MKMFMVVMSMSSVITITALSGEEAVEKSDCSGKEETEKNPDFDAHNDLRYKRTCRVKRKSR